MNVLGQVGNEVRVGPRFVQHEVGELTDRAVIVAADVVNASRLRIDRVGERGNEIVHIHESAGIPLIHVPGDAVQGAMAEQRHHRTKRVVVLPRPVQVEEPEPDRLNVVAGGVVQDLLLVRPLGQRVLVRLPQRDLLAQVLGQPRFLALPVDFGGTGEYEFASVDVAKFKDVVGADQVGAPHLLVMAVPVMASKLSR